jgi:hypothetical protein
MHVPVQGHTSRIYLLVSNHTLCAFLLRSVIREMLRLEKSLDECLERLKSRIETDFYDDLDDVDSIASGGVGSTVASMSNRVVRFTVQERRVERMQAELVKLEKENAMLREEVTVLKRRLLCDHGDDSEEKKGDEKDEFPG